MGFLEAWKGVRLTGVHVRFEFFAAFFKCFYCEEVVIQLFMVREGSRLFTHCLS